VQRAPILDRWRVFFYCSSGCCNVDEETQHYARVYKAKRARLNVIEEQIAAIGEYNVSPHVAMERDSLTEELVMFKVAMNAPVRADVSDELGPRGRFTVYYQQNQDIKKSIAALAVESERWRMLQRNWIILIGIAVFLLVIAFAVFVTYLITKGAL
jgi:hypothetical protein